MVLRWQFQGPLLTSDARLSVLSDKETVAIDWLLWSALVEAGRVDAGPVVERIRRQEFAVVIIEFDPKREPAVAWGIPAWPTEIVQALRQRYSVSTVIGRFYVLVPRAGSAKPAPRPEIR